MEKVILAFASTLQLDAAAQTEFIASLKDGENWLPDEQMSILLTEKGKARITQLKNEQHQRGVRETKTGIEKTMAEFGYTGTDVKEFATNMKASGITEEAVIAHPTFAAQLAAKTAETQMAAAAIKTEFDNYKTTIQRTIIAQKMKAETLTALEAAKVVLEQPALGAKKDARVNALVEMVSADTLVESEGKLYIKDTETGHPKLDVWGKPTLFSEFIAKKGAELYGVSSSEGKGAPQYPEGTGGAAGGTKYNFADAAAYDRALDAETDAGKRIDMMNAWAASQQTNS
jgi:hypothetical protein